MTTEAQKNVNCLFYIFIFLIVYNLKRCFTIHNVILIPTLGTTGQLQSYVFVHVQKAHYF